MSRKSDPKGWGIAAMVVVLALALTASAYAIHVKTWCDPRHPECMKIGPAAAAHGDDSHAGDTHAGDAHAPAGDTAHAADHGKAADTSKGATGTEKGKSGGH